MSLAKSGSNLLRIAGGGGVISVSQDAGGLVGHGYTVTHYVDIAANVGAANDDTDQGATAWTNASSALTPCSWGTAVRRAAAGNIVEVAPGTYSAVGGSGGDGAAFQIGVAGSSGNLIVFTAKYPAAYNASSRTKLRNTASLVGSVHDAPVLKLHNYVAVDGFYFDYSDGARPSTRGIVYLGYGLTGCEVRRCRFDRQDLDANDDGDNYNCIQHHFTTNAKIRDNHFYNGYDSTGSHNEACMTTYGAENFLFENNWIENATTGLYIKGGDGGQPEGNTGTVRYNFFDRTRIGIECTTTAASGSGEVIITQNLVKEAASGVNHALMFENSSVTECRNFKVRNNTFIGTGDEGNGVVGTESGISGSGCEFKDNIVATFATHTQVTVNCQQALTNFTTWDYNRYYENGNTVQYFLSSTHNGLAAWQSASSRDANSTEGDPSFVNQASGDYTLAGGSPCLTASSTGGPIGCYITGSEEIGLRGSPSY